MAASFLYEIHWNHTANRLDYATWKRLALTQFTVRINYTSERLTLTLVLKIWLLMCVLVCLASHIATMFTSNYTQKLGSENSHFHFDQITRWINQIRVKSQWKIHIHFECALISVTLLFFFFAVKLVTRYVQRVDSIGWLCLRYWFIFVLLFNGDDVKVFRLKISTLTIW